MTLGSAQRYFSLAELTLGQGDSRGYSEPEEVRKNRGEEWQSGRGRGVFLGWSVICREEGARYHSPGHIAEGGNSTALSVETADKEEQNNEISGTHTFTKAHNLVTTSTGKTAHTSSQRYLENLRHVIRSCLNGVSAT